ncbi:MAG: hypothetical protein K9J79_05720, partial [Desulfobacteraceae bacterium]|nr:hypothetical protein [Desulfobacteraceae bacterium]
PGTKRGFLFSYLRKPKDLHIKDQFTGCSLCGHPALSDICPVCGFKKRIQEIEAKRSLQKTPVSQNQGDPGGGAQ